MGKLATWRRGRLHRDRARALAPGPLCSVHAAGSRGECVPRPLSERWHCAGDLMQGIVEHLQDELVHSVIPALLRGAVPGDLVPGWAEGARFQKSSGAPAGPFPIPVHNPCIIPCIIWVGRGRFGGTGSLRNPLSPSYQMLLAAGVNPMRNG